MIPLEEARATVLAACGRVHPRAVPLADALGRVTSVPLFADEEVPPFANTAMDGYAVRAADTSGAPVTLRVVGLLPAGVDPSGMHVGEDEAVQIMTGAPMPPGADAVVMVERTGPGSVPGTVEVQVAVPAGNHVRPAGEDLRPGQEVFPAFTVLQAGHLGVLASLGMRRVPVFPGLRVGVLSTGDELVDGPGPLPLGKIRDANRSTLLALVAQAGCEPVDLGLVADEEDAVRAALVEAVASCDVVLTSGGVSMGELDFVKKVLDELAGGGGRPVTSMQVAIRPAKPLSFGVVDDTPVFGLPGNPVSSMVSFELFARPALRQMMGHLAIHRPTARAVADERLGRSPDGKLHLVRVVAALDDDGRYHVRSSGGQASNLLRAMALANALALLPDGEGVDAGSEVQVMLLT